MLDADDIIRQLPPARAYWVAFSGGLDSRVLLEMLARNRARLAAPLGAVHVDHGLHAESEQWGEHCRRVCQRLGVDHAALRVDAAAAPGQSPEAAAREARYRALRDWLPADACLLTAQHRDDQAETLLLQLLRGAGPRGLAAMPRQAAFGRGLLLRPLLDVPRQALRDWAERQGLDWIEDPSNADTRYDRNYLRHVVLPALARRWPAAAGTLARAAAHQAEQAELARALADIDLQGCRVAAAEALSVTGLLALPAPRRTNLLRHWVALQGLPPPPRRVLARVTPELLACRPDATPCVHWPGAELRRYRDALYLSAPLPPPPAGLRLAWRPAQPLELAAAGGVLSARPVSGGGLDAARFGARLEIRFRAGGERLRPAGRSHRHALKKLLQAAGVPAWERERLPLVYADGELVAVPGLCVAEGCQAGPG
ncbi:MAG TPA: tRNA lysidine(34) synthetase TilS, partial [Gammaproteobacteria bacterium]|nr:tRNA lysidine(34) synthetase TilS [Gammaproteobacteria bacterium]